jgi:S1-C subfamily serine protease
MRRYYQILGVSPTASAEEIKDAWLFSLKAFHPDKFAASSPEQRATAEARTMAINEAYRILSDPVSRAVYDRDYFRETSYEKSHSKTTTEKGPVHPPQRTPKLEQTRHLLLSTLPFLRGKWRAVVGLASATGLLVIVMIVAKNKPKVATQEPPFTQIVVPSFVPTPAPPPAAPLNSEPSPAAFFDLPRLASFGRKAVGLVLGFDDKGKVIQTGSGFFISDDGRFVTNEHVIRGAKRTAVKMENGAYYEVKQVSIASTRFDLAILQVRGKEMPFLKFETSGLPEVGTRIAVIGSPISLEGTLSDGIVSAIRTEDQGTWIQITAPISPGSSGSPVLNGQGRVVGVVTLGATGRAQNLNFARSVFDLMTLDPRLSDRSKMVTSIKRTDVSETPRPASPTPSASPAASPSPPTLTITQSSPPPDMLLPSATPSPAVPLATATPSRTYRVVGLPKSVPFLNIRSGPGAHFAVLGVFTPTGRGIILGRGRIANGPTTWQEIFSGNFHGWVNAQYLQEEKSAEPLEAKTSANANPTAGLEQRIPKTPSARGDRSPEAWIDEFVRSFVASTETDDLGLSSSFYAATIDMFDEGRKPIHDVRSDIDKYNKRWPVRRTSVAGPTRVKEIDLKHYSVVLKQDYYVEDSGRREWINGTVAVDLQIEIDENGIPRITSMKQKSLRRDKGSIRKLRH